MYGNEFSYIPTELSRLILVSLHISTRSACLKVALVWSKRGLVPQSCMLQPLLGKETWKLEHPYQCGYVICCVLKIITHWRCYFREQTLVFYRLLPIRAFATCRHFPLWTRYEVLQVFWSACRYLIPKYTKIQWEGWALSNTPSYLSTS